MNQWYYLLALTGNQPTLEVEVAAYFNSAPAEELVVKDAEIEKRPHRDANLHRFIQCRLDRLHQEPTLVSRASPT
jgi:hypothetical protein